LFKHVAMRHNMLNTTKLACFFVVALNGYKMCVITQTMLLYL